MVYYIFIEVLKIKRLKMKLKYKKLLERIKFIEKGLIKIFKSSKLQHCIIVILYKGSRLPSYCVPMIRNPQPKIDIPLENNFSEIYFSALKINPSIKDGAILIQIDSSFPILRRFSCRLFPPSCFNASHSRNKGSGYNSALEFSNVKRVECVYYINYEGVRKFIKGKERKLC